MKKIYYSLASLFVFSFVFVLFNIKVFAYDGLSVVQEFVQEQGLSIYMTDDFYAALDSHWQSKPDYNAALIKKNSTTLTVLLGNDLSYNGYTVNIPNNGYWWMECPWSGSYYDGGFQNESYTGTLNYSNYLVIDGYENADNSVDFDNIYYSPNIPLPEMDVYYMLSSNGGAGVAVWNAEMTIEDNRDYYVQYGYKISVPTYVGIGLDSSSGEYTYSYDSYSDGSYVDFATLEDMTPCINISFGSAQMSAAWQDAYDGIVDSVPDFWAKIPFWVSNPNAAKYLDAQQYYKDYMMTQLPMFGNRLELFARLFTIDDDRVIVGDWLHFSSRSGSKTQEKPSNYIDNVLLPGYVNTSNNTSLQEQENTFDQSGESVGQGNTIINNNYAPNYPDYPTVASYNKDNVLIETIGYTTKLKSHLGSYADFCLEIFKFIPDYVWQMIAAGFGIAIVVMFIKIF